MAKAQLEPFFQRKGAQYETVAYQERLEEEFALIDQFGFTHVFKQVHAILELARALDIPHIIRGSAGSSLVCFFMGITEIDPLLYKLELARFMNKGRKDLPDIDMDVPYNRREELYAAIAKTWPGAVARISNHVTYGAKVALRESAKDIYLDSVSPNPKLRSNQQKKQLRALSRKQFQLSKILTPEQEAAAKEKAKEKEGTLKHYSKHCGGIVIFEEEGDVPSELLLDTDRAKPLEQIRLNKDETEEAGYIKIDILSNRGLAQLIEAQGKDTRGLLEYPVRDTLTERLLAAGENLGITFSESRGMRKLLIGIKPRHMDDLAIALALIRPAAATRGRKGEFLDRWKHGEEDPKDPLQKQIIFDDDAISIIRHALDCDSAEADKWRKAFAKQNPAARIQFRQALYRRGIARCVQDRLMEELDYLALYSFCKSHAVSYAQLVWALAYEKAHNPHQFWCGALNHCHSEFRKWVHYREARCAGLLLTKEKPPYTVGQRKGEPALLSMKSQGTQQTLLSFLGQTVSQGEQSIQEFKEIGYWLSESFLPGCGLWPQAQQSLERWFGTGQERRQTSVKFRGLIATGRILRRDGLCTLLTIGIENRRYIDLVFPDVERDDLFRWAIVEGEGLYEKRGQVETVTVERMKGIALTALLDR